MLYEGQFHREHAHTDIHNMYTYRATELWLQLRKWHARIDTTLCQDLRMRSPTRKYEKPSCNVFLFHMEFEPVFLRQKPWKRDSRGLSLSTLYYSCQTYSTFCRLLKYSSHQREAECDHNPGQGPEHSFTFEGRRKWYLLQFPILRTWSMRHIACD